MSIRDRIKNLRRVKASDLRPSPKNWRTHPQEQQDALRGVLEEVGIADAVLARELDDGTLELVDGHLRADLLPDQKIPVLVLDIDEAEASKLLATLDPLAAMAEADAAKLDELLREIDTGSEALQKLYAEVAAENGVATELKQLGTLPPPAMTWVLVGIPTVQFGAISEVVESIAAMDGTIVETTANDG